MVTRRPELLTDLFLGGAPYPGWQAYNWRRRRFFLLNGRLVLGLLRAEPTRSQRHLQRAARIIRDETAWPEQFSAKYEASRVQLYPDQIDEAKLLEKAATLAVALEVMALEIDPTVDVYGLLRIAPAYHFLDGFDLQRLRQMVEAYDAMDEAGREELAGRLPGRRLRLTVGFQEACLGWIDQPASSPLLRELATGYCATSAVVTAIQEFVMHVFGDRFAVGPCRGAGDPAAHSRDLGGLDAAPSLLPPVFTPVARPA